jgi:membrane protease subunit (stomatin/prohibitin family)
VTANGTLFLRVQDGEAFNREVLQGAITFSEVDLQRFLLPRIQGVLRTVLTRFQALELQQQREAFATAVRQQLTDTLGKLGLVILDLEVVEIGLPAEFKAAISEATLVSHTGRAAVLQASVAAQVKQLEAQALAQASLVQGQAQLQLMAQMQTQGIDPLRMKALEALQSFAEHPAEGVVTDPRAGLFGTVAMAALSGGQQPPTALAPALMAPGPVQAGPAAQAAPAPAPAPAAPPPADPVVDLERQLDALVERLAEGKISEETYKKLSERLESRIAATKRS